MADANGMPTTPAEALALLTRLPLAECEKQSAYALEKAWEWYRIPPQMSMTVFTASRCEDESEGEEE